jgi:hypothetical protein
MITPPISAPFPVFFPAVSVFFFPFLCLTSRTCTLEHRRKGCLSVSGSVCIAEGGLDGVMLCGLAVV